MDSITVNSKIKKIGDDYFAILPESILKIAGLNELGSKVSISANLGEIVFQPDYK